MAVRDSGARLGPRRANRATAAGLTAPGRGGRRGSPERRSALERAERIGEALREVGSALGRVGDLDVLLRLILTRTTEVLEADRATLYLVDGDRLVSRMLTGGRLRTITLGLGEGIAGHVARTGRPVRVRDAQRDPRFDPRWDRTSGYRTRSMLAAPLKNHLGRTVGVLQVLNKRGVRGGVVSFTPRDTELLSALAAQAALSLDQAELIAELVLRNRELAGTHQRLERSLHQLSLLLELETAMNRATTWRELAENALGCAARACEAEGAARAVETTAGRVTLFVVSSAEPGAVRELPLRPGEGIAGEVMQSGDAMRLVSRPREPRRVREALGRPLRCAMAAALAGASESTRDAGAAATEPSASVGAIVLYNRATACGPFAAEDAALLRLIAATVAT
ncbi:MAG: GAF domain-containing protein [Myxococcales bacterium]|nr:GAF domain-containing protein [Myxococcales bacterium]